MSLRRVYWNCISYTIYDSVLIRENTGQWKPVFLQILCSVGLFWMTWKCWLLQKTCNKIILLSLSAKHWLCFWHVFDVFFATPFHYWSNWSTKIKMKVSTAESIFGKIRVTRFKRWPKLDSITESCQQFS